jgi:hypothetical protein
VVVVVVSVSKNQIETKSHFYFSWKRNQILFYFKHDPEPCFQVVFNNNIKPKLKLESKYVHCSEKGECLEPGLATSGS